MTPTVAELMVAGLSRDDAETTTSGAEIAQADQAGLVSLHAASILRYRRTGNRQPFILRARGNWTRRRLPNPRVHSAGIPRWTAKEHPEAGGSQQVNQPPTAPAAHQQVGELGERIAVGDPGFQEVS